MNTELITIADMMPVMSIEAALERRSQMVEFVKKIMVLDTDFGVIPGTGEKAKPTLLKPGAEKLTTFFGLSKRFQLIERTEDWTGQDHGGEPFFYYLYRCQLWRGETLIAEADGSCNSHESKYRYRQAQRKCPMCGKETIFKSKPERGGGWFCWSSKGGCGATFKADDPTIANQETGRVLNPDIADQVNTLQKMSQKRSLIAATLLAVNASEFFTQDLEDFVDTGTGEVVEGKAKIITTGDPVKDEALERERQEAEQPKTNGHTEAAKPTSKAELMAEIARLNDKADVLGMERMPIPEGKTIGEVKRLIAAYAQTQHAREEEIIEKVPAINL